MSGLLTKEEVWLLLLQMLLASTMVTRGDSMMQNCFDHVHDNAWQKVTVYDSWAATVNVFVNNTGPKVLTCLEGTVFRRYTLYSLNRLSRQLSEGFFFPRIERIY